MSTEKQLLKTIRDLEAKLNEEKECRRSDNEHWLDWAESKGPGLEAYRDLSAQLLAATERAERAERILRELGPSSWTENSWSAVCDKLIAQEEELDALRARNESPK